MRKLVVRVMESVGARPDAPPPVWVNLDEFPLAFPEATKLYPLAGPPAEAVKEIPDTSDEPAVEHVGVQLLDALAAHPAVGLAFANALASPETCPIYLRLNSDQASGYPWESMFSPVADRFLALETRWPIARITEFAPADKGVRYFAPPLRVLAVLSAVGIDSRNEWRQLSERVREIRSKLDVRLHVVAGEQEIVDAVKASGDPEKDSAVLLRNREVLFNEISAFDPHVLHFYCHGTASPSPNLELGLPSDHQGGQSSSLFIEPSQLQFVGLATWLIVLNCCRGGSSDGGVRSLAHQLISAGYPAAIGMREPIDFRDASRFTAAFYRALLTKLADDLVPGREAAIEWVAALPGPRQALLEQFRQPTRQAAARHGNWTLPVLYVRPEPLRVHTVEVHPDHDQERRDYLLAQLNVLGKARLGLSAQTPQAAVDEISARLEDVLGELASPG